MYRSDCTMWKEWYTRGMHDRDKVGMTGTSSVTTIHGWARRSHAVERRGIVVTGLAPVMPLAFA